MLNYVFMKGRLTAEPEVRTVGEDETALAKFRLAVPRRKNKDGESKADFFNCAAWNGLATVVENYCHKGDQITVIGTLRNVKWTDKDGNDRYGEQIVVKEIDLCGGKRSNENDTEKENYNPIDPDDFEGIDLDDIPF